VTAGPAPAAPEEVPTALSRRQVTRIRRRAARRRLVAGFRAQRSGVGGLGVLAVFVALALLAPLLFSADELGVTTATGGTLDPPSADYPLGTDESGRSVLALVVHGARVSLLVGVSATLMSMVIGTLVGIGSGHFRGWFGALLQRLTDWFLVIPFLPLAIVLATVLGSSLLNIIVVIGVTSWPGTARLVRAQTLSVEARPYLERARVLGGGDWHQMSRHVLPNVMPLVLAHTTLTVAIAILSETTLSFLGLGDPFRVSWGSMLDNAFSAGAITSGAWWYLLPPGLCVVVVVLAFTLVGRALEAVLDPRLREG
jgi:peptide/nickel transport system permease protein